MHFDKPWSAGAGLFTLLVGVAACRNNDERMQYICGRVTECGHVVEENDCKTRLRDDLDDERATDARASTCAECVSQKRNDCNQLLVRRDCDTACDGIGLITDMYTREDDRLKACQAPDGLCGISSDNDAYNECASVLREQVAADAKLDKPLSVCNACLTASRTAAGSMQTGGLCSPMTCNAACAGFGALIDRLRRAYQLNSVCESITKTCVKVTQLTNRERCVVGVTKALSDTTLASCVQCVAAARRCDELYGDSWKPSLDVDGGVLDGTCNSACMSLLALAK